MKNGYIFKYKLYIFLDGIIFIEHDILKTFVKFCFTNQPTTETTLLCNKESIYFGEAMGTLRLYMIIILQY